MSEPEIKEIEEEEGELVEELESPFNPKEIDIVVKPLSLQSVISRLREGDIDLDTGFQRHRDLWSPQAQSRLIESILIRFPLPSFYFDAGNDDNWLVVDGLQRLTTLRNFVLAEEKGEKPLKLRGLEFLTDYEGLTYNKLPRPMRRRLNETDIIAHIIRPGTPDGVKYSIFHRINTGGLVLNAQEIRHALNQKGNSVKVLAEMVEDPLFKHFVKVSDKRMAARELVLRYFAFRLIPYEHYKPPMIRHLNNIMKEIDRLNGEKINQMKDSFFTALGIACVLFAGDIFSKSLVTMDKKKMLNRGLFEVWTVLLSRLSTDKLNTLTKNKETVVREFKTLLEERGFNDSITSSTTDLRQVTYRFTMVNELIQRNIQ